jgi:Cu/Zn superoxide dismutase
MKSLFLASVTASALFLGACATEPMMSEAPKLPSYSATLAPGAGITSSGKGFGTFTFDPATKELAYNVTYEGLTGPAMAAHIHGPAEPGANAGPVLPFPAATSPITGKAVLTDAQAAELAAGKYYVNVHTAANRGGEIRGQITAN